jgi:serine/threonine protein phosphatase PrpC
MTLGKSRARTQVVHMHVAAFSTAGRRESNQDRTAGFLTTVGGQAAVVLAVADGIGGLDGGEEAASLAIDAVGRLARQDLPRTPARPDAIAAVLVQAFEAAGEAIAAWSEAHPLRGPAGSTMTCGVVWHRRYVVAHVGDSRCYHVGLQGACAVTEDHTEAARLARVGRLPAALAAASPLRHRLTNALGWPRETWVDVVPGDGAAGELDEGDALLFCSDGVHDVVGEADLAETARHAGDPDAAVRHLVGLALARGSRDNASAVLVRPAARPSVRPDGLTPRFDAPKLANGAIV